MREELIIGITAVLMLGMLAQWLAWLIRLPSILLLLLFGFAAGPLTGFLNPDAILGELLAPFVSLSVAIILFEGGLSLRFREIPGVKTAIFSLISVGLVVTWIIGAWGAQAILGLDFYMSLLLGAILTVTGPTVVIPLLREVRAKANLSSILRWEGILIDPIGALLAVLVFEVILLGKFEQATGFVASGVLETIFFGSLIGIIGALVLILLIRQYWVPDYLQNPISLALVLAVFAISDHFARESGLFAVTLMGIILANWSSITVRHIVEFKENLQVLLIGALFIILSARLQYDDIMIHGGESLIFLALMIFVARPVAVFLSTFGSGLTWRDRLFLSWVAPRGIVAAGVASLFALELESAGHPEAQQLVDYVFLIIVGTVVVYGTTAGLVARLLKVDQGAPQGVLVVGANKLARGVAHELRKAGFNILLVDTNWSNLSAAKLEGLPTYYGNVLSEYIMDEIHLEGIGRLFALTPNDEANSLAALRFSEYFGRAEVYQLPHGTYDRETGEEEHPKHLRGRFLFDPELDYYEIEDLFDDDAVIKTTTVTEEFSFDDMKAHYPDGCLPLVVVTEEETLEVYTAIRPPRIRAGHRVIALVKEPTSAADSQ